MTWLAWGVVIAIILIVLVAGFCYCCCKVAEVCAEEDEREYQKMLRDPRYGL